jgi:4-amino-4-deoxy-L-arabinose transferase-like glycosyltransferase
MDFKIPLKYWAIAILILLIPAFIINLGLLTISEDEAIRALVALEMKLSGNYITPTLNGDFYYAKPPLYNWILLLFYGISREINEWTLRIPTVLFMLSFAATIYHFSKKHFDKKFAFINALMFISCGRVLFWDSMLGYIDMLYSWITFLQIMLIYHLFRQNKIARMFVLSYLLMTIGFMLKAFPSLLFQGITLVVFLWYAKQLKVLFRKEHLYGILIFAGIVGAYYFIYYQYNDLGAAFDSLLDQSTRRTIVHEKNQISEFFIHLISYPFENVYHFFPWAFLIFYLFSRKSVAFIKSNDFLKFCSLAFLANIIVYWSSPEVYPRYILMLIPLLFTVVLALHQEHARLKTLWYSIFRWVFQSLIGLSAVACFAVPFLEPFKETSFVFVKAYIPAVVLLIFAIFYYRQASERLIILIASLFVLRIVFDLFILPDRLKIDYATHCREQALSIGERYRDKDLRIYKSTKIDWTSSFYISKTRGKISFHDYEEMDKEAFYVLDTLKYEVPAGCELIETFDVREYKRTLFIIRSKEE